MYIFRAYITTKDGKRIYAKTYGKRAFRIWVGPGPEPDNKHNWLIKKGVYLPAGYTSIILLKGV